MNTTTLRCGCKQDNRRWLVLCEPHLLAWFDTHRIAGGEFRAANDKRVGAKEDVQ
jgi:hypothetical protein